MAYRNYTADGTYWTVRKRGKVYWVARIDNSSGYYRWVEVWGGYENAGSAGGAAAQLAYLQAKRDAAAQLRGTLHEALEQIGLGPMPTPAPVKPDPSQIAPVADGESDDED
ncbi:hypothetical protein [Polymorphospora rubra]|uniref:hypothetical protein n=1 Tax=Polymorphospora rubra TaxID=338584 RepID=UPI0033E36ABE